MRQLRNYYIQLLVLVLLGGVACNKELEKSPLDRFDTSTFWTNETNVMLALTGVYRGNILANGAEFSPTDWWSYNGMLFLEFASDNAFDRRGENSPFHKLSNGTLTATNDVLGQYWSGSYTRVARSNYFLENVGKAPIADAMKARLSAEVRFIRACQYFYLSQYWGAVPLVTQTLTPEQANTVRKAPKAQVVQYVIDELTAAAAVLPRHKDIPASERGRASKQAALAFLGRILLAEGRYTEAAAAYKTIIDFGDHIIDPNFQTIFLVSNKNSNEHVFSTQYLENLVTNGMLQHFFPAIAGGWHIYCPLGSLVESFDFADGTSFSYTDARYTAADIGKDRDPRLKYTVLYNGQSFKGLTYSTHPDINTPDQLGAGKQTTQTGYGLKKFVDEGFSGNLVNYGGNVPVIRYAEVLLSYLEAVLESGQPVTQALLDQTINAVRGRATVNMPRITQTNVTLLREIVRHERRVELACEGTRYWDLLRWKIAGQVLNADLYGAPYPGAVKLRKKGTVTDPYSRWYVASRAFRVGTDEVWPVPQSETNINPNLK